MSNVNILIADNDPDALTIYGEYLQSTGYNVFKASNIVEARNIINTQRIHLVILDLRLTDDSESDRSGLMLAREIARSTPKLILTKWPKYQDVREALKLDEEALPPAVDFLDKKEGLNRLGEAVKHALLKYVRINYDLIIQTSEAHPTTFLGLVELLLPGHSVDLHSRAEELDDLFRLLFYEKSQVKIERLIWQRAGRVALLVFAFAEANTPESLVVVCGGKEKMEQEELRYREFAPHAPGHNSTVLNKVSDTAHFAAHAYVLAGADVGDRVSLEELYHTAPDRALRGALSTLFDRTLSEWHQEKLVPAEAKCLAQFYGSILSLPERDDLQGVLEKRVESIARQLPAIGVEVARNDEKLIVNFGGESFSYSDPASRLAPLYEEEGSTLLIKTPGVLLGSNILADGKGSIWLTDFADAGLTPAFWNHVSLESVARFDWSEAKRLQWLHEMELLFLGPEFSKLYATEVEAPLRKAVRNVQNIRRFATKWVGKQYRAYHLGVLFHAIRRLVDYNPTLKLTTNELTRLAHLLISSALILERVSVVQKNLAGKQRRQNAGIQIDHANRAVWMNGVKIKLRGQSYDLLHELYLHSNELCTRVSLVERVFSEKYEETDESQASRLNTAIHRLREKIEEDPNNPQCLLTEPHGGYRLIVRPQGG